MRRIISFALVLVIMLSLACPVFATAVNSIPNNAPTNNVANNNAANNNGDNPKTGDTIMTWVVVLTVSLIALIAVTWIYRKKIA